VFWVRQTLSLFTTTQHVLEGTKQYSDMIKWIPYWPWVLILLFFRMESRRCLHDTMQKSTLAESHIYIIILLLVL